MRGAHSTLPPSQAAYYYCARMGFSPMAYRGLETKERNVVSHAIRQNQVSYQPLSLSFLPHLYHFAGDICVAVSSVSWARRNGSPPHHPWRWGQGCCIQCRRLQSTLQGFITVQCCVAVYTVNRIVSFSLDILQRAVENGAKGVREPWEEKDEHGSVVMATVQTVSTQHTSPILPI